MFVTEDKELIREILRKRRFSLSEQERNSYSRSICNNALSSIGNFETIMTYVAKEMEVATLPLINGLIQKMVPLVVPIIVTKDISLNLSYLTDITTLVPSTFQVPEPVGQEIPADPDSITTAFIPMLGFDRNGARLGYGAGFFDRFFSKYTHIRKIGLAFSCQEMTSLPVCKNDVFMDMIITEKEIINPGERR